MATTLDDAFVFIRQHSQGALVTLRGDGRPQISNILYVAGENYSVRISVTDSRAKTNNLRRDPRAALHVTSPDFWSYIVLDGTVALSPVAQGTDDAVVAELVDMFRQARGEHPDWDEFRQAMVDQHRVVATLTATHAYGQLSR
ncbi:MAG TPA: PPOX class F420-dependent oxidoreductase [Acidimicrobiales bacterium]|jgi:PPOX class probable F420-dependent enzyme|nr:PPOX class F420-dependent oxidoreductase [Acidimicrobiales bacterium]